jgi:hypothetical protein
MLVNYFLILVALLLFSGLAIDTGILEWRQIQLQNAADSAAQQGMYQFGRNDSAWATEAQAQASSNGFTNGVNGVSVSMAQPPTSTQWVGDAWSVQATISESVPNAFMGLVNAGRSTLTATAVARVLPACIWILDQNGGTNPTFWVASGHITGPCGIYVNTATGGNLGVDGFASVRMLRTRVVGPSSGSTSSGTINPLPTYGAAVKNDPLAYITSPTFGNCTVTSFTLTNSSYVANPGTYCGGMTLNNSTLTLNPGLYIITGGISMTNSFLYGTSGVTLFFTQGGGYGYGTVQVTGSSSSSNTTSGIYLKAPTTTANNGIPGIVVFGDRNWVTHGTQGVEIAFTQIVADGIWYLPNTGLYLWKSPFSYYNYDGWVIDNLYQFGGLTTFHCDYPNLGTITGSPYHYEDGSLVN